MKTLILTASIALLSLPFAGATSVIFTAAGAQRLVEGADLSLLTNTNTFVWIGNFTTESFGAAVFNPLLTISANVTAMKLAGGWKQFGFDTTGTTQEATIFTLGVAATSKLSGNVTDTIAGADYFGKTTPSDTRNLYVWIFKGTSLANATEMGIFRSTDAGIPWTFPVNAGGVGDTVTLSDSAAAAPTVAVIGGAGSATSANLILAASTVPEPSVLALGTMACVGILSGRRRKRQA